MKPKDLTVEWANRKPKTYLQLFFVHYDHIFNGYLIVDANVWIRSINSKSLLRDLVVFNLYLSQSAQMECCLLVGCHCLGPSQRDYRVGALMSLLEEELPKRRRRRRLIHF